MKRTRIKMCGITSVDDAKCVIDAGVDAIGLIFAESDRRIDLDLAEKIAKVTPAWVTLVGVFANPRAYDVMTAQLRLGLIPQFSGSEMPEFCETAAVSGRYLKVFHVRPQIEYFPEDFAELDAYAHATFMFDTRVGTQAGGTGVPFKWSVLTSVIADRPVIIAGGLTAENVGACVREARPFGVDVRSGIESAGKKDDAKVRAFVRAVREADEEA